MKYEMQFGLSMRKAGCLISGRRGSKFFFFTIVRGILSAVSVACIYFLKS